MKHIAARTVRVAWVLCIACGAHDSADGGSRLMDGSNLQQPGKGAASASTQEDRPMAEEELRRAKLRFEDASVPPEYHRSYTITLDARGVDATVDVYGKVIASAHHTLGAAQWARLVEEARALPTALEEGPKTEVTGATQYSLELAGADRTLTIEWIEDATEGSQTATDVAHQVEALVPDLEALKATEHRP